MILLGVAGLLAACASEPHSYAAPQPTQSSKAVPAHYQSREDDGKEIPAVNPKYLVERNRRQIVPYYGPEAVGTIVVDPYARFLYYITEPGKAERYGVAVGREGKGFSGDATIERKQEYPSWRPTNNMIKEDPEVYGPLKDGLPGGLDNPLGARALYLYENGRDTYYRIHGTMDPSSIGRATSAGCIRLFNQDIIDLFSKVPKGTQVKVRTREESLKFEGPVVQLHSGYVVSAYNQVAINEDEAAWKAGMIPDQNKVEQEQHAASVAMAEEVGASGENASSKDCGYPGSGPCPGGATATN
ncbi:L,D-transpeptidase [Thioclava atlantica]|uniref:ErfK/YbiS/YcfS/YnhG family protein n=1 Tax=Thioclava atlantica TaxID=1317124 RepID=A0A085TYG8_9RHOB|nr:ErfK/YbiS/YcfS/YnhG family protein [Thioclava atlantica]